MHRNPAAVLFTPGQYQEGQSREVLTPEQAAILIGALELREKAIVRLATSEGMRPGEILALQMGDLDDDSVWARHRVYKGDIDEPETKRSTPRVALTFGNLGIARLVETTAARFGNEDMANRFGERTPLSGDNIWRKCMYPKLTPVDWNGNLSGHEADVSRRCRRRPGGCSYRSPVGTDGKYDYARRLQVWLAGAANTLPPVPRGDRELREVIALNAENMNRLHVIEKMERETGFEPATSSLGKWTMFCFQ